MPEVNQIQNLLPTGGQNAQIPPDLRMKMLAAQLAEQTAAAPKAPYTSKAAGMVSALTGGLGGLMEGSATQDLMARQQAHQNLLADMIEKFPSPGQPGATAPSGQPAPAGQGGIGSDHVAGGSARDLAIRTIYGEAGGESSEGQAGVAAVLKNRLASGQYGKDMSSVITAPKQFSLWNAGDPAGDMARKLDTSSPAYQKIGDIYDGVMSGQIADPTGGADHYYNPKSASPAWGPQLAQQNDVTIGNHRFVGKAAVPPGQQALADPSQAAAPGPDASIRDHLMAAQNASADMPAPNATPVFSSVLPPGITPDMVSGPATTPPPAPPADPSLRDTIQAASQQSSPAGASPFGGPPQPMAAPSPDDDSLRSAIFAAAAQQAPAPSSPNGALAGPQSDAAMGNSAPIPPPPAAMPEPAPTDPSAEPSLRDVIMASAAQPAPDASSPSLSPNALSGQADSGAGNVLPADAPLPPSNPQSPFGGPPQAMAPPPVTPPSAMADATAGGQPPVSAAPLSTDATPGMDNFNGAGDVTQSSLGASGFTGAPGTGLQAQINGNLPGPQSYVGGDLGLGTPSSAPPPPAPSVASAGPSGPPPAPLPSMAAGNLPAPSMTSPVAAALMQPSAPPSQPRGAALAAALQPGTGAALPATGPMPPLGAQSLANAGLDPDAPAPGASNAGPAPLTSPMAQALMSQPQPMGLAGHSAAADPSSAQNFQRQQMLASMLGGSPAASGPSPQPAGSSPAAPAAPQGGGIMSGIQSMFGGGQQPAPQPSRYPAGSTMAAYDALLRDPMTTPAELEMVQSRMNPAPMKLEQGAEILGRKADGSYGVLAQNAPKPEWVDAGNGQMYNKLDPSQTMPTPGGIKPHYTATRDGQIVDDNKGQFVPQANGQTGFRMMTPEEKQSAGLPADAVIQIGPNGEMHAANGQTINVGGEQNVYDTAMSKQLADNHVAMMQGVDANRVKLQQLNAMSGALQRIQQNGGTTGFGQDEVKEMQGAINAGANALGLGQQFDISDKEVMGKLARQISGAQAKDIGGNRTTNFDMQTMLSANPGLEISPTANQRMLGIDQQMTQRKIDIGQQMQDAVAAAVQQGKKVNPQQLEGIRATYDAQHHIMDPVTGQDLSASPKLPEFNGASAPAAAGGAAPPQPATGGPAGASGSAGATPAAAPAPAASVSQGKPVQVQTPAQAMALPPGTVFMTPDGRTKVR